MPVEVLGSIKNMDRAELDTLADSPIYTWGWLKTMEESTDLVFEPQHIAVRDGEGSLAFTPCYLRRMAIFDDLPSEMLRKSQARALNTLSRIGFLRLMPSLTCGPPEGFSSRILVAGRGEVNRGEITHGILRALEDLAEDRGAGIHGMMGVLKSDRDLERILRERGYAPCLRNSNAVLEIRWKTMEEYLSHLTRNNRKSFKYEKRMFERNGFKLRRISDFSPLAERLSELVGNVYLLHGAKINPFTPHFFRTLWEEMGSGAAIYAAYRHGTIEAFCLSLNHGRTMRGDLWGCTYSPETRKGHVYYNVCYHAIIEDAIRRGSERVEFGPSAWSEKAKFGCGFETIRFHLRASSRANSILLPLLLKRVNSEKERWIRDRVSAALTRRP